MHAYAARQGRERQHAEVIVRDRALASFLSREEGVAVAGFGGTETTDVVTSEVDHYTPWTYLPIDGGQRGLPRAEQTSAALVEAVTSWEPDVLILKGANALAGRAVLGSHRGVVALVLAGAYRGNDFSRADLVLTENLQQESHFARRLGPARVLRLPKLVHSAFWTSAPSDKPHYDISAVSAFTRWKNHAELIPLKQHPVSLCLPGEGPLREDIQQRFAGGLATARFPGLLQPPALAEALSASRILVHPSLSEGFPRAVAEGLAAGLPVVCVKGVVGEPVIHGHNGLLVERAALVDAVLTLVRDEDLRRQMASNARRSAEENFSVESLERAAEELLARLVQFRGAPSSRRLLPVLLNLGYESRQAVGRVRAAFGRALPQAPAGGDGAERATATAHGRHRRVRAPDDGAPGDG